nr:hypothetical protein [Lachnospiraceae bacterium]
YYSVSFLGNYKGHAALRNQPFKIEQASIKEAKAVTADMIYKKPGKYFSAPYVSLNNVLLKKTDYTVRYFDEAGKEIPAGTKITLADGVSEKEITIKITGRGNFAENENDVITTTYQIKRLAASSVNMTKVKIVAKEKNEEGKDIAVGKQEYNGKALTPAIRVLIKEGRVWKELPGEAYEVTYINNVYKGNAVILVTGKGAGYVGCKTAKFTITSMRM